jgi:hypothetical protein
MSLGDVKEKALELRDLRVKKESLDAELKSVNESIRGLEEHTLNSLMEDMGITDVTVDDVHIKKGVVFRGGVTSHTDKDAFKYLFDSHNEGALKQELVVDLAKYPELPAILEDTGVEYTRRYSIHHMTLSSILKELFAEGLLSTEDFEKYSIYAQPKIKVEMNK